MTRRPWWLSLLLALVCASGLGCVDSGCPKGSEDVDGTCMTLDADNDAGSTGRGVQGSGQSGAGSSGNPGKPFDRGTAGTDRPLDGGAPPDGAVATPRSDGGNGDAAVAPATCGSTTCGAHAACNDGSGAPSCACLPGYEGDGQTCTNVDECATGAHDCSQDARCIEEDGTFSCQCKPGFEGDGKSCTANPCEPRVNPCDADTTKCRADGGAAICECLEGRGRCEGNKLACNTDLTSDADHCGACNFACAGDLACQQSACEQPIKALALGYNHTCAIDAKDRILCWGANDAGQLQRDSSFAAPYEPAPTTLGPARLISAGGDFSCAVLLNHDFVCWGTNENDQLGPSEPPDPPEQGLFILGNGYDHVSEIACGTTTSCFVASGMVRCWGRAYGAELGAASTAFAFESANQITLPVRSVAVSVGFAQACAIGMDGRARCWGPADPAAREIVDTNGDALTGVVSIASGATLGSGCATLDAGRVMCWGSNNFGQLGNPAVTGASSASAVSVVDAAAAPLANAVQVAAGAAHACARRKDGSVACWGRSDQLGIGSSGSTAQRSFVEVARVRDAIDIAIKAGHTCVRRRTGQVQCWGQNGSGQLGVSPTETPIALEPVNVLGLP